MTKDEALVQLSRLALVGRRQDIQMYIRRMARSKDFENIKAELTSLMHDLPNQTAPTRSKSFNAIPVDLDSRLQLLRFEPSPLVEYDPIWTDEVRVPLMQIIEERNQLKDLSNAGLSPTKTVLFVGKPGVGKTLAARWLATQLKLPLLVLDLSAVMSSFLGRTGSNLRMVLDYAKSINAVLLLDEIDAIAKRRDDIAEIGELKRLVTVLLQEVDDWPADNLMLAATNHPDLLDPAVWRRFENVIEFPLPSADSTKDAIAEFLQLTPDEIGQDLLGALTLILEGKSFSDIEKRCTQIRREVVLKKRPIKEVIEEYITSHVAEITKEKRQELAKTLMGLGYSQRMVSTLLNISRDTLRKIEKVDGNESE